MYVQTTIIDLIYSLDGIDEIIILKAKSTKLFVVPNCTKNVCFGKIRRGDESSVIIQWPETWVDIDVKRNKIRELLFVRPNYYFLMHVFAFILKIKSLHACINTYKMNGLVLHLSYISHIYGFHEKLYLSFHTDTHK